MRGVNSALTRKSIAPAWSACSSSAGSVSAVRKIVGVWLPESYLGRHWLGLQPLPALYWPLLVLTLLGYVVLTQAVKSLLLRWKWI